MSKSDVGDSMGGPRRWAMDGWEAIAILVAVVIAVDFFWVGLKLPVVHDAAGYQRIAREILNRGLFSKWELSDLRTYGYPLVLAGMLRFSDAIRLDSRAVVFAIQLSVYLGSVLVFRQALIAAEVTPLLRRAFFFAFCLNPFVLIYPSYLLTESLSLSLAVGVFAASLFLASARTVGSYWASLIAGSLISGIALMLRPGSVFYVWVWIVVLCFLIYKKMKSRDSGRLLARTAVLSGIGAAIAIAVPCAPQLSNNIRHYHRYTLFVAKPLGTELQYAGVLWIKYATSYIAAEDPQVKYENPFYRGTTLDRNHPLTWYLHYPGRGVSTLALHVFNVLDQDFPFVYNSTLTPAYYPLSTVVDQFALILSVIGLALAFHHREMLNRPARWLMALSVLFISLHLLLHSVFCVEARYGVVALLIFYPYAIVGMLWLMRAPVFKRLMLLAVVAIYTVGATWVSEWSHRQAPLIVMARQQKALLRHLPQPITYNETQATPATE